MPTNKAQFGFNIDDEYLRKMKFIAKQDTRSLGNLLEHLCRQHIARYEQEHGKINLDDIE